MITINANLFIRYDDLFLFLTLHYLSKQVRYALYIGYIPVEYKGLLTGHIERTHYSHETILLLLLFLLK